MKLTFLLMTAAFLQVSATGTAQTVTYKAENEKLENVFSALKQQTGYLFFYSVQDIGLAKSVTIDLKDVSIEVALKRILADQPLLHVIKGKTVFIKARPASTAVFQPAESPSLSIPPPIDISGRVTDADGNPLVGASVKLKGGSLGTSTNRDGMFVLKGVDENAVLEISFVGYETLIVAVKNQTYIDARLKVEVESLNEVVINKGYYTEKQRFSVSNVGKVTAKDIEKQPVNNPLLALPGRVPGLFITQSSGIPGAAVSVAIQGQNSIRSGNNPFYVVDGVPYISEFPSTGVDGVIGAGNPLSYINPSDIESIEVLKDADATAIYGSRAANGAILITTKKGRTGRSIISISIKRGWGNNTRRLEMMNTEQYLEMRRKAYQNSGITNIPSSAFDLKVWDTTRYTDWQDVLIGGTAQFTNLNGSMSGGTSNIQYLLSTTYQKETTVFSNDYANQKGSVHLNLGAISNNRKIKVNFTTNFMLDKNNLPRTDLTRFAILLEPNAPKLYSADGTLNWEQNSSGTSTWRNPLAEHLHVKYENKTINIINNLNIGYEILQNLEFNTSFGYTNLQTDDYMPIPSTSYRPERRPTSIIASAFGTRNINSWSIEPQLNYKLQLNKSKFEALLGATILHNNVKSSNLLATGFSSDQVLQNLGAATNISGTAGMSQYKYNAAFGRINFIHKEKYIANLNIRRDGSSRFGKENYFQNFASIGGAWIFSDEKIFRNQTILTFGKIKGSFGTTGNDQIENYSYLSLYNFLPNYGQPYQGGAGLLPNRLPNPYLQWEETKKLQGGIEIGLLEDRIFLTAVVARNRSSNQLLAYAISSVTGFDNISRNFPATVQNTSKEFTLTTANISNKEFKWTTNLILTIPKNKLISFPNISSSSYASTLMVGQPLGIERVLHYTGVDPSTGLYKFVNAQGQETTTPDTDNDKTTIISTFPKFYGGMQNSFKYKGFEIDIHIQYTKQMARSSVEMFNGLNIVPGVFSSGMSNQPVTVLNAWDKPGDIANVMLYGALNSGSLRNSLSYLTQSDGVAGDASFIRVKNLNIIWNIPKKFENKMGFVDCRLFIQGQNLFTITKYRGLDPETQGIGSLPPLRLITAGVNISL